MKDKNKIYVRNIFGDIYRIVDGTDIIYETDVLYNRIVKKSENIIDLVQEEDFVNGLEVQEFYYEDGTMLGIPVYTSDGLFNTIECWIPLEEINIKEILTKERYKQNYFKVVE